ncbi:MAG: hypothetical protein AAB654_08210, partial [Acidobacteriota bacterium]
VMYELDKQGLAFPASPLYTSGVQIGAGVSTNMNGCHISRFGRLGDNIPEILDQLNPAGNGRLQKIGSRSTRRPIRKIAHPSPAARLWQTGVRRSPARLGCRKKPLQG